MSKRNTFQKILISTAVIGTAMYAANKLLTKQATAKNLLDESEGSFYSFKYGNIFYKVSGEGTPVLLIHDIHECSSGAEWIFLERKLAEHYKVYTLDLIGCGRSDKPKLTYNNFLYVQLITDFIKEVIGEKTNIIATGNSVAPVIMTTKLCEECIDKIALINPADLFTLSEVPDHTSKFKKHVILCPILGTFIYHMVHLKKFIRNTFIMDYFSNPGNEYEPISDYYHESCHKNQSGSKYLYASILAKQVGMDIHHGLKVLDKEILIISGEDYYESDFVPDDYAELNDHIECVSIMDTSYLPQLEKPSKVMDLIEEYWKE